MLSLERFYGRSLQVHGSSSAHASHPESPAHLRRSGQECRPYPAAANLPPCIDSRRLYEVRQGHNEQDGGQMTPEEQQIAQAAGEYAKQHRSAIAREVADPQRYAAESNPLTVFMAGSPGAGKTEVSKALVETLEQLGAQQYQGLGGRVLRIDPDDFRDRLPGYTGGNSWLFQSAVSAIVERVLDRAFNKRLSFLLDGTLSSFRVACRNIERALARERSVWIMYVYQCPQRAWGFVQAREVTEGRNIPVDEFIAQFFAARQNVIELKRLYGERIQVDVLIQNGGDVDEGILADVSAEQIDALIPQTYDEAELRQILGGENEA